MSAPGLAQIWSLGGAAAIETGVPPTLNYDIWVVNSIILHRTGASTVAAQLNIIPSSETRLRNEGFIPFYSHVRKTIDTLKSSARERGLTFPDIPDIPEDWREEAASDYKSLAAQLRPHLAEQAKVTMDWNSGILDRDSKPHWTSLVAAYSASFDLFLRMEPALCGPGGAMGGSEWGPYLALMASTRDEFDGFARVFREEILRIRAQPGSGWGEEEAKGITEGHMGAMMGLMAACT